MGSFSWLYNFFVSGHGDTPMFNDAISLTEFIIMLLFLSLAISLLLFYCCRLWVQVLHSQNEYEDPLLQKDTDKIKVVTKALPSCSKIVVMPDGTLNYGLDDQYTECPLSPNAKYRYKGLGFSIPSQLKTQASLSDDGTQELRVYDDNDSCFDQASFYTKSCYSRVLEEVCSEENQDKDYWDEFFP
eukprot:TRINITY_DN3184_c0_g2_i1.p1 TRINITY_DN3184_c0_g2~~TRINITY_DN3184_c0_g2_i1.p1  ORF type:complete len:186 (+),score=15.66 TRINITY_DN3184_c0_g2_i1:148-705(+)